jgi:hypothetical protein
MNQMDDFYDEEQYPVSPRYNVAQRIRNKARTGRNLVTVTYCQASASGGGQVPSPYAGCTAIDNSTGNCTACNQES